MYAKRQTIAKTWPIPRKGTKYVVAASHDKKNSVPLLVVLRDILKVVKNRREIKKILREKAVSVNDKIVKKDNFSILPFDIIKIGEKDYELGFSDKGKFIVRETIKKTKILKIIGKKVLKGKKIQLNLLYGKNILANEKEKTNIGDSVVIDKNKIVKVIKVEKNREAVIFSGKYKGKEGKIEAIEEKEKIARLSCKNEKINVPIKNIIVVG